MCESNEKISKAKPFHLTDTNNLNPKIAISEKNLQPTLSSKHLVHL